MIFVKVFSYLRIIRSFFDIMAMFSKPAGESSTSLSNTDHIMLDTNGSINEVACLAIATIFSFDGDVSFCVRDCVGCDDILAELAFWLSTGLR